MMIDELFLRNGWPTKGVKPYFQLRPLSVILTIANLQHPASRIWAYAEPEFRLCWMKLYSSDNLYTKVPQVQLKGHGAPPNEVERSAVWSSNFPIPVNTCHAMEFQIQIYLYRDWTNYNTSRNESVRRDKDVVEQLIWCGSNAFIDRCKQILSIFVFSLLMTVSLFQPTENKIRQLPKYDL